MKHFFDFLMISGVILGIIFIIATQISKNGRERSIIFLNLVVAFLMLNNLQAFSLETIFTDAPFYVQRLQIPWYLLIMPSFYAFLIYYLRIEKKVHSYTRISLGLFILQMIIRITMIPYYNDESKNLFIGQYVQTEEIVNAAYSIFLFVKSIILLFRCSEMYKTVLTFDSLRWLKNFMFLGGLVILMWICAILLNRDKAIHPELYIYYPLRLSTTILLYWICYQGFYSYSLMSERIKLREAIAFEEKSKIAVEQNGLSEDTKFEKIKNHIEKNKRYLDPYYSLEKLSSETEMSVSTLSHLINQESGYNFSDYINYMRVKKVKKYLSKPDYSSYTIVAIGLECGFNSKSVFYAAFRKFTSVTPSAFKKHHLSQMS
ncbi:helix-turn-helix domain-containing protein [Flavobacterium limnosediminis]|nr:helix-turn-helix domain-containing protein [Flavobacterium limnosediminis]